MALALDEEQKLAVVDNGEFQSLSSLPGTPAQPFFPVASNAGARR